MNKDEKNGEHFENNEFFDFFYIKNEHKTRDRDTLKAHNSIELF